jgi:hypothetical protein
MAPCCCSGSGGGSCGQCLDNRHKAIQQIKLERLQAIRIQEKILAKERAEQYSQLKEQHKRAREDEARKRKYQQQAQEYQQKCSTFAEMMASNGTSHRSADSCLLLSSNQKQKEFQQRKSLLKNQQMREAVALQQRQEEIQRRQDPERQAQERRGLITEQAHLDRETASLSHQNHIAKQKLRQQMTDPTSATVTATATAKVQKYSLQSAESIESRGRVTVQAKIVRHGQSPQFDDTLVTNTFREEKDRQQKLTQKKLHRELTSQVKVNKRFQIAQKFVTEEKELRILSDEFEILEKIDRSGNRVQRLNSREKVIQRRQQEDSALIHRAPHHRTVQRRERDQQFDNSYQEKERYFDQIFEKKFVLPLRQEPQEKGQEQDQEEVDGDQRSGDPVQGTDHSLAQSSKQFEEQYLWQDQPAPAHRDQRVNRSPYKSPGSPSLPVPQKAIPTPSQRSTDLTWAPVQEYGQHVDIPIEVSEKSSSGGRSRSQKKKTSHSTSAPSTRSVPGREDYISTLYQEALQTARDVFESTFLHHRADLFEDQSTSIFESEDAVSRRSQPPADSYDEDDRSNSVASLSQSLNEEQEEMKDRESTERDTNAFSTKYYLLSYQEQTHPSNLREESEKGEESDDDASFLYEQAANRAELIQMTEIDDHSEEMLAGQREPQGDALHDISDDSLRFLST